MIFEDLIAAIQDDFMRFASEDKTEEVLQRMHDLEKIVCKKSVDSVCRNAPKSNSLGYAAFKHQDRISDEELLMLVLKSCDEETLIEMEQRFGRNTKLSNVIHEKIRCFPKQEDESAAIASISDMLQESQKYNNPLYEYICRHMDRRGYKNDAEFYKSISMSRQNFSRIRNKNKVIGKFTILWIAVGLQLSYNEVCELLNCAGFTFNTSEKRDIIVSYIIRNVSNYDLDLVNRVLVYFEIRPFCEKD